MRAAILFDDTASLELADVVLDRPRGREVRIQLVASGVCHTDLHFIDGTWPSKRPLLLGHEVAGIVIGTGSDVTTVANGDQVMVSSISYCGHCEWCLTGRMSICPIAATETRRDHHEPPRVRLTDGTAIVSFAGVGGFAEEVIVDERQVVALPPEMPLDRAALIGCSVTTGTGAVFRTAQVRPGESVAVVGCGGVGLAGVQAARIAGAGRIIGVDVNPAKLIIARQMGATDIVDASAVDPVEAVRELSAGGVDHAFEMVGLPDAARQAFAMTRRGGTATIVGMMPPGSQISIDAHELFTQAKRVQGSLMGSNVIIRDMPRLVDLYLDGRLLLDELVSHRFGLDEIGAAVDTLARGAAIRTLVDLA